jgi:hypothetical protein
MHPRAYAPARHDINDAWAAQLWDVQPRCQVAGIVDNRSVLLDRVYGALIRWHSLKQVPFTKRRTVARQVARFDSRALPWPLLLQGLILVVIGAVEDWQYCNGAGAEIGSDTSLGESLTGAQCLKIAPGRPAWIIGAVLSAVLGSISFAMPHGIRNLYRGKLWDTQAYFFGMQGIPNLGQVEEYLFGPQENRMTWSTNGSTLSRYRHHNGECQGLPPDEATIARKHPDLAVYTTRGRLYLDGDGIPCQASSDSGDDLRTRGWYATRCSVLP